MTRFNLNQKLLPLSSVNIIQKFSLSLCMMISHSTHDFIRVEIHSVLNLEITMVTFSLLKLQNAFKVK